MICADIIVGVACMTYSDVGSRKIDRTTWTNGTYLFFIYYFIFLTCMPYSDVGSRKIDSTTWTNGTIYFFLLSFSGTTSLSMVIVDTFLISFYTLSISIRTVVERGVYVIVPISHT